MAAKDFNMELKGGLEISKILESLPAKFQAKVYQKLNRKAGNIAKKILQQNAPDGDNTKSGDKKHYELNLKQNSRKRTVFLFGL